MDVTILDKNFNIVDIVDTFESIIWTDRYCAYGDFEIFTKADKKHMSILLPDYYIYSENSEHIMMIENRQLKEDSEDGDHMIYSGRSLESILTRRIVWGTAILQGSLQNGIAMLLNDNIINPQLPERKIDRFVFEPSNDPIIVALTVDCQYSYTDLYETIQGLCSANDIGFKITLSEDNNLVFKLYSGVDRSYDQITHPHVVFSPDFDNLISGSYAESNTNIKNVALVAGEGEGVNRITVSVGSGSGLDRRELYTDARDLSKTVDGTEMSDDDYALQLARRGIENLLEHTSEKSFDGQADTSHMFTYGEDFFLGDVVHFSSEYSIESRARITEIIMSQNTSGIDIYPTFAMLD